MAGSIARRPNGKWRARYRDETGHEHTRHFDRKVDAQQWLDQVTAAVVTGTYADPKSGQITFAAFYGEWSARQVWAPGTVLAMSLAARSVPFAAKPMRQIRRSDVEVWIKSMDAAGLAPGTIKTRYVNVRSVFRAAVRDRVIGTDPTDTVRLPRRRRADAAMSIPTPEDVGRLMTVNGGAIDVRNPKYGSERVVHLADGLVDLLAQYVADFGTIGDKQWLFTGGGDQPPHQNTVGYWWRKTLRVAGLSDIKLHDLRHFYASGLIAAGCEVVTVQRSLGHAKATTTLNTYAHLWPTTEDRTRKAAQSIIDASLGDEDRNHNSKIGLYVGARPSVMHYGAAVSGSDFKPRCGASLRRLSPCIAAQRRLTRAGLPSCRIHDTRVPPSALVPGTVAREEPGR